MKSPARVLAVTTASAAGMILAAIGLPAVGALRSGEGIDISRRPGRVVIVSMPAVTWEDVAAGHAPNLASLAEHWSMGAMSIRTVGPRTDPASAYATISAGNRARGLGRDNMEFHPITVHEPNGGLVVKRIDDVRRDNARELHYGAVPGTLGDLLHRAGLRTAVVGNLDGDALREIDPGSGAERSHEVRRFAGLALADGRGRVDAGDTDDDLVTLDPATSSGFRTDPVALLAELSRSLDEADVVMVELGDAFREGRMLFPETSKITDLEVLAAPERAAAVERDDSLLGGVLEEVDLERDSLLVVGTAGLGPAVRERLMVAVLAGRGAARGGWLSSSTTQRAGLVTIADTGPAILRLLGIQPPQVMTGRAARPVGSRIGGRLDHLLQVQKAALFHLRWLTPFFAALIVAQLLLYLSATKPATRAGPRGNFAMRFATLCFLALPGATFVWHAFHPERLGPAALPLLLLFSVVLAAFSMAGPWRKRVVGPPAFICLVTFGVIAGDLVTGANLQMSTLIGYSPIVAGRFFGMGNLAFAVFGTAAILVASSSASFLRRGAIAVIALMAILTAGLNGAPTLGADFGGLVSLIIGFGVLLLGVGGRRISWVKVGILSLVALGIALVAGYLDSLRAPEAQTHMGRFVERLIEGGPSAVADVIARKALANWSVATNSLLSLSVPVAGVFLYLLMKSPRGRLRVALKTVPGLSNGLIAAAALNLAGFVVNDSGIAVPAMGLAVGVPYCLATILALQPEAQDADRTVVAGAGPKLSGDVDGLD